MKRIEEVAFLIGVSTQTVNNWYRWKASHPDSEYAPLLPDYVQIEADPHKTRYWSDVAIEQLVNFKNTIPHGRKGILGDITQKYSRKK